MIFCQNADMLESSEFLFYTARYPVYQNQVVDSHAHEFLELVYVAEGEGEHEYRGQRCRVAEGDVFLIEPNVAHAYRVGPDSKLVLYNVLFQPSVLSAELEALTGAAPLFDYMCVDPFLHQTNCLDFRLALEPAERVEMMFILDRIIDEFQAKKLGYRILIKTHLIELFIFLSRCYDVRSLQPQQQTVMRCKVDKMIRQVCEWIELHFAQALTLEQMSKRCGMRKSEFSDLFKQYTGKTFADYRNGIRIQMAKHLLENGNDKMIHVASTVGIGNISSFCKLFLEIVGVTPGQYRQLYRSRPNEPIRGIHDAYGFAEQCLGINVHFK